MEVMKQQLGPELFLQRKTLERVFIYLNRSTHSRLRPDITCLSVRYTECKMAHSKLYKCQQCWGKVCLLAEETNINHSLKKFLNVPKFWHTPKFLIDSTLKELAHNLYRSINYEGLGDIYDNDYFLEGKGIPVRMTPESTPSAPRNFPIGTRILGDLPSTVLSVGLCKLVERRCFRSLYNRFRDKGLFFLKIAIMGKKRKTLGKEL